MRMRKFYTLLLLCLFSFQAFSQIPEYCLDNDVVHRYLTKVQYDPNDYSYSRIMEYCYSYPWDWEGEGNGVRLDVPLPAKVKLANALNTEATLYVSEYEDYSDALVKSLAIGTDSVDVYNLIPNRTYNWKVECQEPGGPVTVVESGQFKTTGLVRMLKIDGIYNVRDLGGWIGLGGNPIKYGKLIRGSRLNVNNESTLLITQDGIDELRRLGIRAELDMRNSSNAAGAKYSFLGEDIPIKNIENAYNSRIATFADAPQSIQGIKQMIAWFKEERPVYLHCSVGADRTGTVAYLVGALCGMSEDALCKEFELTSFSGDKVVNERQEANGDYERLVRQRDYSGRLDPNDNQDSYKFASIVDKIKSFPGGTLQRKVYNHLREGVQGEKISEADLAFLIRYLTDYVILAGFNTDVDTIRLEAGQTHKLQVAPYPAEAEYSAITFKSTSDMIATVTDDGLVTATGVGSAYIIVDVDGIEKYIPVIVPITEETAPGLTLENDYVSRYMNETYYSGDDYSVSYICDYQTDKVRKDAPNNVTLRWSKIAGVTKQRLVVSERADFGTSLIGVDLGDKDSTYKITDVDLFPGKIYYYKISGTYAGKSDMTMLSSGFKTSGTVRMIRVRNAFNIRDLGGWTGLGGHKVKYNAIFRGSRLRHNKDKGSSLMITTTEVSYLKSLGINAELDFRSDDETNDSRPALNFKSKIYLRAKEASLCQGENILSGSAYIESMNKVIEWLRNGKVIYMSGTFGAERTGTMAFLINGLLGVDEDGLSKDYELSTFTGDTLLTTVICKRNAGDFPAMVSKIKTLEGATLQQKIYNYFKVGYNNGTKVTAVSEEDLDWFICYMLDIDEAELNDIKNDVKPIKRAASIQGGTYNVLGQEVPVSGSGMYIMDGKTVYVTE